MAGGVTQLLEICVPRSYSRLAGPLVCPSSRGSINMSKRPWYYSDSSQTPSQSYASIAGGNGRHWTLHSGESRVRNGGWSLDAMGEAAGDSQPKKPFHVVLS